MTRTHARKRIGVVAAVAGLILSGLILSGGAWSSAVAGPAGSAAPAATSEKFYYHNIKAKHSGYSLNVAWTSTANGAEIVQFPFRVTEHNSHWLLDFTGETNGPAGFSTTFAIRNRLTNQCLDVQGSTQPGAAVVQQPCDGTFSQEWYYGPESDSGDPLHRFIYNVNTGYGANALVLNVREASTQPSARLALWHRAHHDNSKFSISAPVHVTVTTEVF